MSTNKPKVETKPASSSSNSKPETTTAQPAGAVNSAKQTPTTSPSRNPSPNKNRRPGSKQQTASPKLGKNKNKKSVVDAPPYSIEDATIDCPPGLYRIFLTSSTQQQFNLRTDEDVTQEDNIRKIPKALILEDIKTKLATSDFYPLKQFIEDYSDEDILIIYDYEFQYDKNFYICLSLSLKDIINDPPIVLPPEVPKEAPRYVPPVSKPWMSYGSEIEIDLQQFKDSRLLFTYEMQIQREKLNRQPKFIDDDQKECCVTIPSFEDSTFETKTLELEKGIQSVPECADNHAQTLWRYPKNSSTQYEPRTMTTNEIDRILSTDTHLHEFMKSSLNLFESALQQNEIMNAFSNDWQLLGEEMSSIGGPGDIHLKEYQSFTDIHSNKNKMVTCVQWHPTIQGTLAMSLAENSPLYDRYDNLPKSVVQSSLILIWSFFDPIHPKLFLEAPCDVFTFAFSPTEPHIIAAGCINGQIALFDIQPWEERLTNPRGDHRDKDLFIPGFEDESFFQTPHVRYCALSSIEHGHTQPINDLIWIPDHYEVDKQGFPSESKAGVNYQLMTSALDSQILFWDTRMKSVVAKQPNKKDLETPMGIPQTFKHLVQWKPFLRVTLPCADPDNDFAPTKFSISERQGDRPAIDSDDKQEGDKQDLFSSLGKASAKNSKLLQYLNTRICVGTEDGQFVYVDWIPQKDTDTSKMITPKPDWSSTVHDGPIVCMKYSPFFKDIILVAGGTAFSIWKEKVFTGPLLQTSSFSKRICDAEWSPTRPGVFFIAKHDGSIDVWDILDRTHMPILTQSISIRRLSFISCKVANPKQQLIAIGDSLGTLHVMEVPWSLRRHISGELQAVKQYFQRETDRRGYVKARWDFREKEKDDLQRQIAIKAGLGPPHMPTDDEVTFRLREEYNEFLRFELSILREMGKSDADEPAYVM